MTPGCSLFGHDHGNHSVASSGTNNVVRRLSRVDPVHYEPVPALPGGGGDQDLVDQTGGADALVF